MALKYRVSVIIPSYNGASKLAKTLTCLSRQTFKAFEVVLVIDGSTDNTMKVIGPFRSELNLIVLEKSNGGRARARNAGAEVASGNLFIFQDDDVEILHDNIETHVRFAELNKDAILVANPFPQLSHFKSCFAMFRYTTELEWAQGLKRKGTYQVSLADFFFSTQNVSVPRFIFEKLHGFDGELTDSEDFDFGVKAMSIARLYVNGNLTIFHHDEADLRGVVKRQTQYYESKNFLLSKHPEYESLLPKHFEWKKYSWRDPVKRLIFGHTQFWYSFFDTVLFRYFPFVIQSIFLSTFIYTHSVIPVKSTVLK